MHIKFKAHNIIDAQINSADTCNLEIDFNKNKKPLQDLT